jgi:tetratricopeptide (TPR) repeat protein
MDEAQRLFEQALAHQGAGRPFEAEDLYRRLLSARPELNAVRHNLAVCLTEQGKAPEALTLLEPLVRLNGSPEVQTAQGNALRAIGRFEEALKAYSAALEQAPMDPRAHSNQALAYQDLGRMPEAVAGFRQAVALAPNESSLRANLGGALLMSGDFAQGFPAYEFRLVGSPTEAAMKSAGLAVWNGQPLKKGPLLVWTEQGLGDSLQFLRFVALLNMPVALMTQAGLQRLAAGIGNVVSVQGWQDAPPACERQAALLSLPRLLGCKSADDIPPSALAADPLLVRLWGERLGAKKGFRIGLSWQGNPAMKADAARSAKLSDLAPLFDLPGIDWISLQTGEARGQIKDCPFPLQDLGGEIADLADTAAIMAHLDLVIAVDSAPAHLAGALNRPVWVLVRANPDWRWPPMAVSSPWYPTARLWRQAQLGDWGPVVASIAKTLPTILR